MTRIPGGLTVEVSVDVDETGGDDETVGIDLSSSLAGDRWCDVGDRRARDGDVGVTSRGAGAVDEGGVSDDEIVCAHGHILSVADGRLSARGVC